MNSATLVQMILEVIGGLGLFLLGMKHMSEGMQAVAGASLRRMISAVTDNRLLATGVGTFVTCIVQSSSITTVMVIGFVNSGLMQLSQGVGVIMGANIGTTITGWILVLNIGKYGLPIMGGAAFVYLFSREDRRKFLAMAVMGVGMVFFGLELMKDACAYVKELPAFEAWFREFRADSYLGVLACAIVGCGVTMVVQSSSATLGITISLAYQGVISYPTAAALVLGENIGTTITAYLASLGATTNARRAAYFHVIFNIVGVFWITLIFQWYIGLVLSLVDGNVAESVVEDGKTVFPHTTAAIAATHTLFNVANTLIFLPFVPRLVRLLERLIPSKAFKEKPHLTDLDIRMLDSPSLAIEQSRREIQKMGDGCRKMMEWVGSLLSADEPDRQLVERVRHRERVLDSVQDEVAAYITDLLSASVPQAIADEARRQLRITDEYESVSDYVLDVLNFDLKLRKEHLRFTPEQRSDLLKLHDMVLEYLMAVNEAFVQENPDAVVKLGAPRKQIRAEIKRLRAAHLKDLSTTRIAPQVSVAFMATLNAYSRVRDHSDDIAEAIRGES